jgi:hypothetical protein
MNFGDFGFEEEDKDMKKFMMMMDNVHINLDLLNFNKNVFLKINFQHFFNKN